MKLFTLIILISVLQSFSILYGQQEKVLLSGSNMTFFELIKKIEEQTSYQFVYQNKHVENVSVGDVNYDTESVEDVLKDVFKGTELTYRLVGNNIIIMPDEKVEEAELSTVVQAQAATIKGNVVDAKTKETLIGVNIVVKGTGVGAVTDLEGNFEFNYSGSEKMLQISYVGYQSVEVAWEPNKELFIKLFPSTEDLEEVVVTALGIRKEKRALAYSVTELRADDVNRVKVTNIATGLVGKVAGVDVVKPSTGAMGSSRITIRGSGSLQGDNQPLYIIDGVPMTNSGYGQAGVWGGSDGGDGISSINSDDIESISVLKGGTAAALYGSRAANGAIVITTKQGTTGFIVEYNASYMFDTPTMKTDDFQWEYGQGMQSMKPSQYMPAFMIGMMSWGAKLDGTDVGQFDDVERPYVAQKNNFENFYNNAWTLSNNVSLSTGNDKTRFRISIGDIRTQDLTPESKLARTNVSLNLSSQLTDKFQVLANVLYVRERVNNRPNVGDIINNANTFLWIAPTNLDITILEKAVNDDGSEFLPTQGGWIANPYFIAKKREQMDSKDRFIGSMQAQYDFTDNWYIRGRAGGDVVFRRTEAVTPKGSGTSPNGSISAGQQYHGEFNVEAIAGYTQNFNDSKWTADAFVGWNTMTNWSQNVNAGGDRFIQPNFNVIGNTEVTSGGHSQSESFINSIFGQAEFSYERMLYLTLTGRNDWFSALSFKDKTTPNHVFYPSVGLGFILSEAIDLPSSIPFLKLRAAWAQSGGGFGAYGLGLTYGYNQSFNGNPIGSVATGTIPNLNLEPFLSTSYEFGFDARFLNNRLGLDATYYVRNTSGDIVSASISNTSGYGSVRINAGEVHNSGIEVLLTGSPIRTNNFEWNSSLNFSYNKSEIKHITDAIDGFVIANSRTGQVGGDGAPGYIYNEVGEPYGIIKGYSYLRDDNGNKVYDEKGYAKRGELTKLGESAHPWMIGFNNDFQLKGFSLNVLIDAKFGGKLFSQTNLNVWSYGKHGQTLEGRDGSVTVGDRKSPAIIGDGVTEDGKPNTTAVEVSSYYRHIANNITEEFVYDASFVKLREVSFGYNFPTRLTEKMGLQGLRLSAVARNLCNLYDKVPLVDPESALNNSNAQGMELYGVPTTRSWGFNLNIKF